MLATIVWLETVYGNRIAFGMSEIDKEPKTLKAKLWINDCPFEHIVIPKEQLAPELKAQLSLALIYRSFQQMTYVAMLLINIMPQEEKYRNINTVASAAFTLPIIKDVIITLPILKSSKIYDLMKNSFFMLASSLTIAAGCSKLSTIDTKYVLGVAVLAALKAFSYLEAKEIKEIGNIIKQLNEQGYSPFPGIDNSVAILQKYHRGEIDNAGNLVLTMHPDAEQAPKISPWQAAKRRMQWSQPLQRAKFEVSKPTLREKEPIFAAVSPALAPT